MQTTSHYAFKLVDLYNGGAWVGHSAGSVVGTVAVRGRAILIDPVWVF